MLGMHRNIGFLMCFHLFTSRFSIIWSLYRENKESILLFEEMQLLKKTSNKY